MNITDLFIKFVAITYRDFKPSAPYFLKAFQLFITKKNRISFV